MENATKIFEVPCVAFKRYHLQKTPSKSEFSTMCISIKVKQAKLYVPHLVGFVMDNTRAMLGRDLLRSHLFDKHIGDHNFKHGRMARILMGMCVVLMCSIKVLKINNISRPIRNNPFHTNKVQQLCNH